MKLKNKKKKKKKETSIRDVREFTVSYGNYRTVE